MHSAFVGADVVVEFARIKARDRCSGCVLVEGREALAYPVLGVEICYS